MIANVLGVNVPVWFEILILIALKNSKARDINQGNLSLMDRKGVEFSQKQGDLRLSYTTEGNHPYIHRL